MSNRNFYRSNNALEQHTHITILNIILDFVLSRNWTDFDNFSSKLSKQILASKPSSEKELVDILQKTRGAFFSLNPIDKQKFIESFPCKEIIEVLEDLKKVDDGNTISKTDLFPFLKRDIIFRNEVGTKRYGELMQRATSLPEKCKQHVTGEECRKCAINISDYCVINVIGIVTDSEVMPHHGFEYSDLLIQRDSIPKFVPVIAKGNEKITASNDKGLARQLQEKLRDALVSVIVIACSGQIARKLIVDLEHMAKIHNKALIFVTAKDLAQFLNLLENAS